MPPHIFHALSDDPARWERQFGCMAALFQMFQQQHPRVFRKRGAQLASNTNSGTAGIGTAPIAAAHSGHSKPASSKSSTKNHCKDGTDTIAISAQKRRRSERGRPASDSSTASHTSSAKGNPKASPQLCKINSPSILDSARATATIREPPRKSFDDCCSSSASSRSLPGSPYMGPKMRDHGRSQVQILFDQPRASLDGGREQVLCGVLASSRHSLHRDRPLDDDDGVCKDPLQELKESIRSLAKLQQATQKFVDSFEAQRALLDDNSDGELARRSCTAASAASCWNARSAHSQSPVDLAAGNTIKSIEAGRTSSFDYTEAVRISQKIQEIPARLSLDGREVIPKAVLKLREAMRSRLNLGEMKYCPPGATKEDFISNSAKDTTTEPSNSATVRGRRRPGSSNVIARLMGLDDIPSRSETIAKPADNKEPPASATETRLLKDLLRCPPQGNRMGINHDCCEGSTKEERQTRAAAPVVSDKVARIEGLANMTEDCKVIEKQAKTNPSKPKRPGSKHALEVMPSCSTSPKLERRRGAPAMAAGIDLLLHQQREYGAEQKLEDSPCYTDQERKTLKEIIEAMQLNGLLHARIPTKQPHPLQNLSLIKNHEQSRMVPGDDQVPESQLVTDKSNTSAGSGAVGSLIAGGQSSIVVIKPCRTKTLSMETHFSFDVPTLSAAVAVDHELSSCPTQPKQGGVAAKDVARGIANNLLRPSIGQRNDRHGTKVADKITHDQSARVGAARSPISKSKCREKVPTEPPIPSKRCSSPPARKGSAPKQPTAKFGTGSDRHHQATCADKIKSKSGKHVNAPSNRKKWSFENIEKSISKFSAFGATVGAGASKVAGVDKLGKNHRKTRKGESQLLATQASSAQTLRQASSHPYGCSTEESGLEMSCQPPDLLHSANQDVGGSCLFSKLNLSAATAEVAGGPPELLKTCNGTAAPELLSPISVLDTRYDDGADLSPLASTNNDKTQDAGHELGSRVDMKAAPPPNSQFEYVKAILQHAGLSADKEDAVLAAWMASGCAIKPAVFLELERTWRNTNTESEPPEVANGGQQRKLIFDCIDEILAGKFNDMQGTCRSGRGFVRAVWRDLERLVAPPATVNCKAKQDRIYALLQRDVEQGKDDGGWTYSAAPTAHIAVALGEAIFQDLLLEVLYKHL